MKILRRLEIVNKTFRSLLATLTLSLFACGGGGGGGGIHSVAASSSSTLPSSGWQSGVFKPAANFANKCVTPRTGIDPSTNAAYRDRPGSIVDENNFLRSWSNDTYLWYTEIADVDPLSNSNAIDYFDALKTNAITVSGNKKDKFHFTYNTAVWNSLSQSGESVGYGMELLRISDITPRSALIAYTEPGSPAAAATTPVMRGAKLMTVDGVDFINGKDTATVAVINAGLFPSAAGEVHTFGFQDDGTTTTHFVTLQAAVVTKTEVQNIKTINTSSGKVGYFLFNDHLGTAEQELISAVSQLKTAGITDLVLDIRYNGGGYLSVASELAYMIGGNKIPSGSIFESETFNDKHTVKDIFGSTIIPTPFFTVSSTNAILPTLNLSRVFVITTGDTCSASEAVINGLRGVNVEVIQIGSQTCGKPYAFFPQDNCGTTYFTIQLKGANNKGYGDYSDGFIPSATDNDKDLIKGCVLGDDLTHALGDEAEKNLAAALSYRLTNSCPLLGIASSFKLQKPSTGEDNSNVRGTLNKEPSLMNRIFK